MNKKNRLLGLVIPLFLVASAFSTYSWWQCREDKREMLVSVYTEFEINRWELEHMGEGFEYLLQGNASGNVLLLYTRGYRDHAYVVKDTFEVLYLYSGEEKFWKLRTAMTNLGDFLNTLSNRPPEERMEGIRENLETLNGFDALFKELNRYQDPFDIPTGLAEEFFNTSEQLKW